MSRKDFQLIADVLVEEWRNPEKGLKEVIMLQRLRESFAKRLAGTNDRFDYDRFIKACTKD